MLLIACRRCAAYQLLHEVHSRGRPDATHNANLEHPAAVIVLTCYSVLSVNKIRIDDGHGKRTDLLRHQADLRHTREDQFRTLCDQIQAGFTQPFHRPSVEPAALDTAFLVDSRGDRIDLTEGALTRMQHFELRRAEIPLKQTRVANVVRGQHAYATHRGETTNHMFTQRLDHVDDLHGHVLLQFSNERMAQKAWQQNRRDAAFFEIADHVEDIKLALSCRGTRCLRVTKRMLFEHDVEVLSVCTRRARLDQLEQHIRAGERP